jgi:hypothetical protein
MSLKALSDYTQYAKYARYIPEKQRRETWQELVDRVFDMHKTHLGEKYDLIKDDFDFAKDMVSKKRILGSQRALQFGGDPILKKNAKIYNCCASYVDRVEFFKEALYLLLCGCGVGASVQKHHIAKLPKVIERTKGKKTFIIPDTIEGWADAVGVLMQSFFDTNDSFYLYDMQFDYDSFSGYEVEFDYSLIRPQGASISWGGIAPGPLGLKRSIELIENILNTVKNRQLKPIEVYDILMHMSDSVLSGGIRRSATIIIFSHDDEEMATAKTGDWFITNPQRGRSNNSALLVRDDISKDQFSKLMKSVKEFGEPGFIWTDNKETMFNPCITKDMMITTDQGAKSVEELIGKQFNAIVNGKPYTSTADGFFFTGNKEVFEIETEHGFTAKSTCNHKFLTSTGWKELKDIKIGDEIVIHDHKNIEWTGKGTFGEGWLLGSLYGDGNLEHKHNNANLEYWGESREILKEHAISYITSENLTTYKKIKGSEQHAKVGKVRVKSARLFDLAKKFGISSEQKMLLNNTVEKASSEFYCGYLRGWFDADGSIQGNKEKGVSVRLSSVNYNDLQTAQRMLMRLGIFSKIYKDRKVEGYNSLPDGNGGYKDYYCKATNELIISCESIKVFKDRIGFHEPEKMKRLDETLQSYKRKLNKDKKFAKIKSITSVGYEDVYDCTIDEVHAFDVNGLYAHNCSEISLYCYDEDGNSGWNFCNLSEINGKKVKSDQDFYDACRAASILGTIQATYMNLDYLSKTTKNIIERDALLGVSITGMMDNPTIIFDPKIQRHGAKIVLDTNEKIAKILDINPCARSCTLKPSGTASCILGTSSGIHPNHAKKYIRRVQANKLEFPAQEFAKSNPLAVEESVWSNNKTDVVLSFLCEVPDGAKTKNKTGAIELLEHVKLTQQNWIEHGTRKNDWRFEKYPWLRHNVSNTISVKSNEWDDVEDYIYKNRKWFAGISLLPMDGDKDYPQAPFTTIYDSSEIVKYYGDGALLASGLVVDGLHAFNNNLWVACDCVLGIGETIEDIEYVVEPFMPEKNGYTQKQWNEKLVEFTKQYSKYIENNEKYKTNEAKKDWCRRVKQFANRYVNGDLKKCTYLLKDVSNLKLWLDLKREYKEVDWSNVKEEKEAKIDVTKIAGAACSGGNCDLGELGESMKKKQEDDKKK